MAQEVHAESLKKREEELAQREMLLLGREISMLIQVGMVKLKLPCLFANCCDFVAKRKLAYFFRKVVLPNWALGLMVSRIRTTNHRRRDSNSFYQFKFNLFQVVSKFRALLIIIIFSLVIATKINKTVSQEKERPLFQTEVWKWQKNQCSNR